MTSVLSANADDEQMLGLTADPPGLIYDVSPHDSMHQGDGHQSYFFWGRAALRAICCVLDGLDRPTVSSVLDFGCGHGRVFRMLKAAFPSAQLAACDIDRDGVEFCARTFGAMPIYAADYPRKTVIPNQFDLIWCGSLLTHLDEARSCEVLALLARALTPDGVLIFTTHGEHYRELIYERRLELGVSDTDGLIEDYIRRGFGYRNYALQLDYGISMSSLTWISQTIERIGNLRLQAFLARGWGGSQDVYGCICN